MTYATKLWAFRLTGLVLAGFGVLLVGQFCAGIADHVWGTHAGDAVVRFTAYTHGSMNGAVLALWWLK